jgi:GT2 family glycosyltransferase
VSRVSILIVNYRSYDELEQCLVSLRQFEPGTRVVVVDHEADAGRVAQLESRHPHIEVHQFHDNPGFGAGVNRAARLADTDDMVVLNPDVVLTQPIVAPIVAYAASQPTVGIIGGLVREESGARQPSARTFPNLTTAFGGRTSLLTRLWPGNPLTHMNLVDAMAGEARRVDWVTGAFMFIRRRTYDDVGGFDERFFMYWEDADLCRRAATVGWDTAFLPAVSVLHLTGRASRHVPIRTLVAFHRSVFYYYWKHGGLVARALSPIVALGLFVRFILRLPSALRTALLSRTA